MMYRKMDECNRWEDQVINNGKLVSIIVPIYNSARYLRSCVDSLLAQTYGNVEIILVDDGSSDESGHICDQYGQISDRIRVFHKENGGVSSARNLGIVHARGEYLMFVDSDDCTHREQIAIYMEALREDAIMICGVADAEQCLSQSYMGEWREHTRMFCLEKFMDLVYADYFNVPWNKLYEARTIKNYHIRFDESKNLGEDFMFNLEYFRHAATSYEMVDCPLYFYQEGRQGSLDNSFHPYLFDLQKEMFTALRAFLQEKNVWNVYNQLQYWKLYWDRLYLTVMISRAYARARGDHEVEVCWKKCLTDNVWEEIDAECRKRKLITGKRRWKKLRLDLWRRIY